MSKRVYLVAGISLLVLLTGCQTMQEQQANVDTSWSQTTSTVAKKCRNLFPKSRKDAVKRATCMRDDLHRRWVANGWSNSDLNELYWAEQIVLAERYRDGKISKAEAERDSAAAAARFTDSVTQRNRIATQQYAPQQAQQQARADANQQLIQHGLGLMNGTIGLDGTRRANTNCYGSGNNYNCTTTY